MANKTDQIGMGAAYNTWPYPGENAYNPATTTDPVRKNAPWYPTTGNRSGPHSLPVVGLAAIVGVVLLFEYMRKSRGR